MEMQIIGFIIAIVFSLYTVSFTVTEFLSNRPANGELKRLENLDCKLKCNVDHLKIVSKQKNHYVEIG